LRRTIATVVIGALLVVSVIFVGGGANVANNNSASNEASTTSQQTNSNEPLATTILAKLPIKGRAPSTGYSREKFGGAWANEGTCTMRDKILTRDLTDVKFKNDTCEVASGILQDPYTGEIINFTRGVETSSAVQIDHVVAIGNAWQTGAQQISQAEREQMYNDPLELLAVDGSANQQKSDGDAATWLPANKSFRCQYVARQIAVKQKYSLWVTSAEHDAISRILASCPDERLPEP
jgi:hypothetical protein